MSIFDLIFILGFLASVVTLITAVVAMIRRRRATVVTILRIYGVCAVSYLTVAFAFAYLRPQRVIPASVFDRAATDAPRTFESARF